MKPTTPTTSVLLRRNKLIVLVALILIAAAVRVVHDRTRAHVHPTRVDLEQAARTNPNDLDAQLNWGAELHRQGQLESAKAVFTAADALAPQDARASVWLGMIDVQQHRTADAITAFKRSLTRDPKDPDVWLSLADMQQAAGALKDAEASFETVTRLQPGNEPAWRLLGELDVRRKLLARGQEALQTAARLAPKDVKAQSALGRLDLRVGRLPEAKAALEAAATQDRPDAVVLAQLAQADMRLDASPASLQSSMELINRSVSIKSTADGLLARGQVHLLRREYPAAIEDLNSAIQVDKQLLVAYGYLSQAYAAVGKADKAKRASEQYMAFYRSHDAAPGDAAR